MTVDPFSIINIVLGLVLIAGYGFRYHQTKASPYLWLLVAVLLSVVGSIFFVIDSISPLVILLIVFITTLLSVVVVQMTMAYMLRMWGTSMRESFPGLGSKAVMVGNGLLITYPIVAILCIVCIVLALQVLYSLTLLYVAGVLFLLACILQVVICGWLYASCTSPEAQEKKSQMLRLLILSLLSALPYFLNMIVLSTAVMIIGSILLWIFHVIALLPNALVGYDIPPESQAEINMRDAPVAMDKDMNTFDGLVQTGVDQYGQPVFQKTNAGVDQFGQPIVPGSSMVTAASMTQPNIAPTMNMPHMDPTVVNSGMSNMDPGVEYVYVDEHGMPIQGYPSPHGYPSSQGYASPHGYASPQQPVYQTSNQFVQGGMVKPM